MDISENMKPSTSGKGKSFTYKVIHFIFSYFHVICPAKLGWHRYMVQTSTGHCICHEIITSFHVPNVGDLPLDAVEVSNSSERIAVFVGS